MLTLGGLVRFQELIADGLVMSFRQEHTYQIGRGQW